MLVTLTNDLTYLLVSLLLLQEYWWLYLCDKKKSDLITVPVRVTNLVDDIEIDVKFPAPRKTGVYTYTMCLKSDSYIDMDLTQNLKVLILFVF